jgi:hypothetical protein
VKPRVDQSRIQQGIPRAGQVAKIAREIIEQNPQGIDTIRFAAELRDYWTPGAVPLRTILAAARFATYVERRVKHDDFLMDEWGDVAFMLFGIVAWPDATRFFPDLAFRDGKRGRDRGRVHTNRS